MTGAVPGEPDGRRRAYERDQLDGPMPQVAIGLLGGLLVRDLGDEGTAIARIVEVEAYHEDEPASHSYKGRTPRCASMFGRPGTSYVYRSYGVHWCLNVVVAPLGVGAAVLVRAATSIDNVGAIRRRRSKAVTDRELLRGPGRLTAGLDIDGFRHDGGDLLEGVHGLWLASDAYEVGDAQLAYGPRVGVSQAADLPWRWWLRDAPEVSAFRRSPRARAVGSDGSATDDPHGACS